MLRSDAEGVPEADRGALSRRSGTLATLLLVLVCPALIASCGGDSGGTTATQGGSLTVLLNSGYEGAWPTGLDPAENTNGAANQSLMNSIYGNLFQLAEGGKIVPDLASGYKFSDGGRTVTITLRKGVKFQDGTPFDAEAVAFNIKRDLKSPCTCSPAFVWPGLAKDAVTTEGTDTVALHFEQPFAAVIHGFIDSNANWIASPTALQKLGVQKFKQDPVGAGPFEVVKNTPSSELVLKRYAGFWQKGRPYLDNLTFKSIGGDQAALQALQAGQAQVYEDMSTPPLIDQAASEFTVTQQDSTSPYVLQLNTAIPPFDDKQAREAIYYATDTEAIASKLFDNRYPLTQSFTGPGGLFHHAKVPGYRTYDPAKAKAIVSKLGGLTVDLGTINVLVASQTTQALQSQWAKAGIKTKIHADDLARLIQNFESGKWQAMLQTAGSWDPAAGVGVAFRFGSKSPFSGVHDPKLDGILGQAASSFDDAERDRLYAEAAKYLSDQADAPFMFAFAPANVAVKGVEGPGITTRLPAVVVAPNIPWEDVSSSG